MIALRAPVDPAAVKGGLVVALPMPSSDQQPSTLRGSTAEESLLRLIAEATQDFYCVVEPDGGRSFVSPAYFRVTGFTPEEIRATDFRARIHPDDLHLVEQARRENFGGKSTRIEYRALRKDGSILRLDLRAQPILDDDGRLKRILCRSREAHSGDDETSNLTNDSQRGVRLLIVDDHAVLRRGLRMLMESQADLAVVGEAGNGDMAVELAQALRPDVVTLDLTMPGESGLKVLERLRNQCPDCRVLVLTMHDDVAYIRAVLAAGGAGYVTKSSDAAEVILAVRTVARGRTFFSLRMNDRLARALLGAASEVSSYGGDLTQRERDVLSLVAQGHTNRKIADQLALSLKSIESYRARLMAKFGFANRAELVRYALQAGLLEAVASGNVSSKPEA